MADIVYCQVLISAVQVNLDPASGWEFKITPAPRVINRLQDRLVVPGEVIVSIPLGGETAVSLVAGQYALSPRQGGTSFPSRYFTVAEGATIARLEQLLDLPEPAQLTASQQAVLDAQTARDQANQILTSVSEVTAEATLKTSNDAIATAADRVQTGIDAETATTAASEANEAKAQVILHGLRTVATIAALSAIAVPGSAVVVGNTIFQENVSGIWADSTGKKFAPAMYVVPKMFGEIGGVDDAPAVQSCWDYGAARNIPAIMDDPEYNCVGSVYTSSNLTVQGAGAVLYALTWPSIGGFVTNVRPIDAERIQSKIRIYNLITDGSKLPVPTGAQNTNLGPGFSRGASDVRIVDCVARKILDGAADADGTGGGGFGCELGAKDIHYIRCHMQDCYRGARLNASNEIWASGAEKSAIGIVFTDCVWERCGAAIFAHSVGAGGDNVADLGVYDVIVRGGRVKDCGHYPWRAFDYLATPSISPQKTGVFALGGAQNIFIDEIRVQFSPGYPDTFTDWRGRTGYPAAETSYIGAGLSGPVGMLIQGWGKNVVANITLDGSVDTLWDCERPVTFGDVGTVAPTNGDGVVEQWLLNIRLIGTGATYGYAFDSMSGLLNTEVSAVMSIVTDVIPTIGVAGPNGTAGLNNVTVRFLKHDGAEQVGTIEQWLAFGNMPSANPAQAFTSLGGASFAGGYSATGARQGITIDGASGFIRASAGTDSLSWLLAAYGPLAGLAGGLRIQSGKVRLYTTTTAFVGSATGSPEGVISAGKGSLISRNDGGAETPSLYVKTTDGGTTGWAVVI